MKKDIITFFHFLLFKEVDKVNKLEKYFMGIDTSNYTSSIAVVDENNNVVFDDRIILNVKNGERGLRQSDALFQHINNLPHITPKMSGTIDTGKIKAISVSARPRSLEDSYMPVFLAGKSLGKSLSDVLKCNYHEFSHQQGHVKAAMYNNKIENNILKGIQISGGTTEVLNIANDNNEYLIDIIGETKDISIGQLVDRVGVKLGYEFPCGKYLDEIALATEADYEKKIKKIYIEDLNINLSGTETQCMNLISKNIDANEIIHELFAKIADALISIIVECTENNEGFLLMGGVASSEFIRNRIIGDLKLKNRNIYFGERKYSLDNAVGTALLGKEKEEGLIYEA